MLKILGDSLRNSSGTAMVIISISLMLFLGFLMTRITKRLKLPNVTAYILTGILIGPFCLDLIPAEVVSGMDFISDIALAFIAFSVGEFFRVSILKKNGLKVVIITLMEALTASCFVFIMTYFVLHLPVAFSVVLAALASATAPTSTIMTIRQTGAHGDFVETLLQVVALDDAMSLMAYSIALSIALASIGNERAVSPATIVRPLLINLAVLLLGCVFGILLKLLFRNRSNDNRLIVSIAVLFAFCGVCAVLDVSPLLGCMSMGTVYINITEDDRLFKQLNYFSPPILLLFFVKSGIGFRLDSLMSTANSMGSVPLLAVGILYFVTRILGKYVGAFLGCAWVKKPAPVRNYLGFALIPQASVAIGLAAIGARTIGGDTGSDIQTIILAASVLNELIGPAAAKLALYLSGAYSDKLEDLVQVEEVDSQKKKKTEIQLLIERIAKIQEELPAHEIRISEEEQVFTEEAERQRGYHDFTMQNRTDRRQRGPRRR